MDIMKIWTAYQKNANPETIFPMYQECELNAKAEGYGDVNLLHIASQNAHPEAIAWLLEQGLNPNEASRYGELPLFLLAKKGFSNNYIPRKGDIYQATKILLDGGGNVLRRDSNGMFCYHYAAQQGNDEFFRALAECNTRLNKVDEQGNTALHLIAQSYYNPLEGLKRVNEEIKDKRNKESLPVKQRSPISMEVLEQRKKAVEEKMENLFCCAVILLDAGVNPEIENNMLETAHTLAVRAGAKKLAALLDGSYSPDQENSSDGQKKIAAGGMTLHQAVRKSDEAAVCALVDMGEDINAISEQETFEGLSPLAVACQTCDIPMVSLLLKLGANPSYKNSEGEQPIVALFGSQIMIHTPRNLVRDRLVEQLVELGVNRILTSGQQPSAPQGAELLSQLVKQAAGRIIIMPGCGVNEHNVAELARATGAQEFHMSARHRVESGMVYRNERVSMGGTVTVEEFARDLTDPQRVAKSIEALRHV